MKVIILEDEFYTAEDLKRTLSIIDANIEVIAVLQSVKEAKAFFSNTNEFDLIFSDIQLGDGVSFEVFKQFEITAPIVFITAYNDYAMQAFNANGVDYILKPFGINEIKNTLEKVKKIQSSSTFSDEKLFAVINELNKTRTNEVFKVLVYHKEKIIPIPIHEIALFYIDEKVLRLVDNKSNHFMINYKMEELEKIGGNQFYRANRQYLINRSFIKEVNTYTNRKQKVILTISFNQEILISKEKTTSFLDWIKGYVF
jgi:DNA-binding LytR/AlgR family response regulator